MHVFSFTKGRAELDLQGLTEESGSESIQQERQREHRKCLWLNSPWPLPAAIEMKLVRIVVHISTLYKA